ncbi:hypothetical protein H5123_20085 [Shewanella sp. SR43-4]|uniref:hypothetical protein n=1 Tax=Shewanella sp. SR43-4 TaxID=2760942 RepID=UPI0015F82A3B|nr:hypothetical protein [Shewanella sp. SR43-4]MBB1319924.1 hypothetical protein [Shewanella sp. SR43-4]
MSIKYVLCITFLLFSVQSIADKCSIDEAKYEKLIEIHSEGNGNFLVSAPIELESKKLVAMRLNVKVNEPLAQSVQGELKINVVEGRGYAHINKHSSINLQTSVTVFHENSTGCPIITVKVL